MSSITRFSPVLLLLVGGHALRAQYIVLVVDSTQLQAQLADLRLIARPVPQRVQGVSSAQVAHAERPALTRCLPGLVIHVDVDR